MAVPKRRKSKAKVRSGRANKHKTPPTIVYCPNCGSAMMPHRICPNCGQHQGRTVVETEGS